MSAPKFVVDAEFAIDPDSGLAPLTVSTTDSSQVYDTVEQVGDTEESIVQSGSTEDTVVQQ